jgi:hypothetical protein
MFSSEELAFVSTLMGINILISCFISLPYSLGTSLILGGFCI